MMYFELLKRFDGGKALKELDPIEDMEIEFDDEQDDLDIKELVNAKVKVSDELLKQDYQKVSKAQISLFT